MVMVMVVVGRVGARPLDGLVEQVGTDQCHQDAADQPQPPVHGVGCELQRRGEQDAEDEHAEGVRGGHRAGDGEGVGDASPGADQVRRHDRLTLSWGDGVFVVDDDGVV